MTDYIIAHPDNIEALRAGSTQQAPIDYGIPIIPNPFMPRHATNYIPPADPFVEYDEKDAVWLRYFGLGRSEIDRSSLLFYRIRTPIFADWVSGLMRDGSRHFKSWSHTS